MDSTYNLVQRGIRSQGQYVPESLRTASILSFVKSHPEYKHVIGYECVSQGSKLLTGFNKNIKATLTTADSFSSNEVYQILLRAFNEGKISILLVNKKMSLYGWTSRRSDIALSAMFPLEQLELEAMLSRCPRSTSTPCHLFVKSQALQLLNKPDY